MRLVREFFESSILRYLGVGGTAFVVDFGATVLARDYLHLPLWLAVSVGIIAGFVVNFALQRNFTFQSDRPYAWSMVLYFLLVGFNWVATTAGMYAIVEWMGYPTAVGKLVCTIITTLWNYPLYRFIVFPPKKTPLLLVPSVPFPQTIDYIIPAHNSASLLPETVRELHAWAQERRIPLKAIIVENGSSDDTAQVATGLAQRYYGDFFSIEATVSDKGLGYAYRHGIRCSQAELVILSADDLPFGMSDIDSWMDSPLKGLAIGSKAHPDSQVERGLTRAITSAGFRFVRSMLIHSKVGDPQGTLLADGQWLREIGPQCQETGYLSSTEIVAIAEAQAIPVAELPVILTPRQADHRTRISLRDVWDMGVGLIRIKKHSQSVVAGLGQ